MPCHRRIDRIDTNSLHVSCNHTHSPRQNKHVSAHLLCKYTGAGIIRERVVLSVASSRRSCMSRTCQRCFPSCAVEAPRLDLPNPNARDDPAGAANAVPPDGDSDRRSHEINSLHLCIRFHTAHQDNARTVYWAGFWTITWPPPIVCNRRASLQSRMASESKTIAIHASLASSLPLNIVVVNSYRTC